MPRTRQAVPFLAAILAAVLTADLRAHGDLHERIAELTRRIAAAPGDARLYLDRADLHRRHRDWKAAEADVARAEALDPKLDAALLVRSRIAQDLGASAEAEFLVGRFLALHPGHGAALEIRAKLHVAAGRRAEARADLAAAIPALPGARPDLHLLLASLHRSGGPGGVAAALATIEDGLRRAPGAASLESEALVLEAELGDLDAAAARVARLVRGPGRADPWWERWAGTLFAAGRRTEAAEACRQGLAALSALPPRARVTKDALGRRERLEALLRRCGK